MKKIWYLLLVYLIAGIRADYPQNASIYASYAQSAYSSLQNYFLITGTPALYLEEYPAPYDPDYSFLWPFTQVFSATLDMTGLPNTSISSWQADIISQEQTLEAYWDANPTWGLSAYDSGILPPYGSGGPKYYDDNAWTSLDLLRDYIFTDSQYAFSHAKSLFTFVFNGWDSNPRTCDSGGTYWMEQAPGNTNNDRNTISNAPNSMAALILYNLTSNSTYLTHAKEMYEWVVTYLRDPSDGLYWDHVTPSGSQCEINTAKWSYNQGVIVGASLLLYLETGVIGYLANASQIAQSALSYYGCPNGKCSSDASLFSQPPPFNAIFFRNLLALSNYDGVNSYRDAMVAYAQYVWANQTSTPEGPLFEFGSPPTQLLNQAAVVQVFACLAWDSDRYLQLL
eukprot:TRINITY_DN7470_c0_g1_i1.p1 TRINITY_DN7470_c0_g1~~TRINITY_DN7470_c0_g1_i1.p1  ORF type:complete len:396 (-),score=35.99 TRINITY_DN7470_c0_g1_i1:102-1289(-)